MAAFHRARPERLQGLGNDRFDFPGVEDPGFGLEQSARETGGRSYFPERAGQLSGIYRQISADLKHQYALAYTSTNHARDGLWRTITLKTRQPGLEVQTRAGYYAPGRPGGGIQP